jgi:hypothetical protein
MNQLKENFCSTFSYEFTWHLLFFLNMSSNLLRIYISQRQLPKQRTYWEKIGNMKKFKTQWKRTVKKKTEINFSRAPSYTNTCCLLF